MEIIKYDYNSKIEYSRFIRKYNRSKCMNTLNSQTISKGKKIYLIIEKSFFQNYKIIGYAIIYEDLHAICYVNDVNQKYDNDFKTIFISDFMIDLPYRNQGFGTILVRHILSQAQKEGIEAIHLDVIDKNTVADKLYEKLGFKYISTENIFYEVVGNRKFRMYEYTFDEKEQW